MLLGSQVGTEMVDLLVGPEKKLYRVHKTLLCNKAPYFEKMFKNEWQEASSNTATFPEDTVESFDLLLGWIYSAPMPPLKTKPGPVRVQSWNFVLFFALASKLCLPRLMDRLMDIGRSYHQEENLMYDLPSVQLIYKVCPENSTLRIYAIRSLHYMFLNGRTNDKFESSSPAKVQEVLHADKDLCQDFLKLLQENPFQPVSHPKTADKCEFHCHEKADKCPNDD